jgi:tripartite-type tricarboxylate transporter receptor subunit TctC
MRVETGHWRGFAAEASPINRDVLFRRRAALPTACATISCLAALTIGAIVQAAAQNYPTKPVTLITPAAAGNSPDVVTRMVADRLTQLWKYQVVVINRPGAGGLIAAQAAAAGEKDGYTLYATQSSTFTVLPITQQGRMPVDLHKAFVPIGMIGEQPIAAVVNKEIAVGNVAELIALINKTPG